MWRFLQFVFISVILVSCGQTNQTTQNSESNVLGLSSKGALNKWTIQVKEVYDENGLSLGICATKTISNTIPMLPENRRTQFLNKMPISRTSLVGAWYEQAELSRTQFISHHVFWFMVHTLNLYGQAVRLGRLIQSIKAGVALAGNPSVQTISAVATKEILKNLNKTLGNLKQILNWQVGGFTLQEIIARIGGAAALSFGLTGATYAKENPKTYTSKDEVELEVEQVIEEAQNLAKLHSSMKALNHGKEVISQLLDYFQDAGKNFGKSSIDELLSTKTTSVDYGTSAFMERTISTAETNSYGFLKSIHVFRQNDCESLVKKASALR